MRFCFKFCVVGIFFGSLLWSQVQPPRHQRGPGQQQNAADFAPDPPPISSQAQQQVPIQPQPQMQPRPVTPSPGPAATPAPQAGTSPTPAPQPEQLPPATPPQVTFANGLLTVEAKNSSLGMLLTAIRNKTGIQFEGLESGAPERVAISMGPAPEGDVLTGILAGSGFDYVIMERPDSPGIVQRVLLTGKGGVPAAVANGAQPASQASATASDDDDEDAAEEPATPQDTPVRPPIAQQIPPQQPQTQAPKTPEQYYEELKRQQQQQQQGQAPPNPAPIKPSPPHP